MPYKCTLHDEIRSVKKFFRAAPTVDKELNQELKTIDMNLGDFIEYLVLSGKLKDLRKQILDENVVRSPQTGRLIIPQIQNRAA